MKPGESHLVNLPGVTSARVKGFGSKGVTPERLLDRSPVLTAPPPPIHLSHLTKILTSSAAWRGFPSDILTSQRGAPPRTLWRHSGIRPHNWIYREFPTWHIVSHMDGFVRVDWSRRPLPDIVTQCLFPTPTPACTRRRPDDGLMSAQRLRPWAKIRPSSGQPLVPGWSLCRSPCDLDCMTGKSYMRLTPLSNGSLRWQYVHSLPPPPPTQTPPPQHLMFDVAGYVQFSF